MKAEIVGQNLVITIPLNATPERSASGKTLVVASVVAFSRGNQKTEDRVRCRETHQPLESHIDGAAESCAIDGETKEGLAVLHLNLLSAEDKAAVTSLLKMEFERGLREGREREQCKEED